MPQGIATLPYPCTNAPKEANNTPWRFIQPALGGVSWHR
jgi:hypothetical protein